MDSIVHTYAISFTFNFITLDGRYDRSSQAQRSVGGIRSIIFEHSEFGYWTTSLIFTTNEQDRSSWLRWSVTHSVIPHLIRIPHLPSAASLRYHLRAISGTTDHHKLRRWYFLHFFLKNIRIHLLERFPANKEKLT